MNWFVFALISVLATSIGIILQRVLLKEKSSDPFAYALVFQFSCAALITTYALINGFQMPPISDYPLNFFLTGVFYAGYTILFFKALQTTDASDATILTTTRVFWTMGGSVFFLGENLNMQKVAGTLLIISAIMYVTYRKGSIKLDRGKWYAIIAAAFFGLAFVNDAFLLQRSEVYSYSAVSFLIPTVFIALLKPRSIPKARIFLQKTYFLKMFFLCIIYSFALVTIYLAYQLGGEASKLSPIGLSVAIVTTILAAVFLGEKEFLIKKIISAILVIIGVMLLR